MIPQSSSNKKSNVLIFWVKIKFLHLRFMTSSDIFNSPFILQSETKSPSQGQTSPTSASQDTGAEAPSSSTGSGTQPQLIEDIANGYR